MTDLFEALMIVCFGVSWPICVHKSLVSKTAKGKSPLFEVFAWIGYCFGITRKIIQLVQYTATGVRPGFLFFFAWFFYVFNITFITIDLILYRKNSRLDKLRENEITPVNEDA